MGAVLEKKNVSMAWNVPSGFHWSPHAKSNVPSIRRMARTTSDGEFLSTNGAIPERGKGWDGQQEQERARDRQRKHAEQLDENCGQQTHF